MTEGQSKSGTGAAVVIVVALVVLLVPCLLGVVLVGGGLFAVRAVQVQPIPLPPVPGANAPLPAGATMPGNKTVTGSATITVNNMKWSQNLFDATDEILTLAKYDEIKPGMTYIELVTVLAIPEHRRPEDMKYVGEDSKVELKWFGGPGDAKSITVKLKGQVVTDKSQSGLK